MAWQHFLFETRTGNLIHEVEPMEHRWETRLNGYGEGASTLYVGPGAVTPAGGWASATTPWSRGVVSLWDGVPVYAGVIDGRGEPNPGSGAITLTHAEVWKLLARRYLWGVEDYVPTEVKTASNLSRRGLVAILLNWLAGAGSPGPRWQLPLSLPGLESGSLTRPYRAYRFDKGMELIEQVLEESGGPDLYLRPRLTGGLLEWRAEIGSPRVSGVAVDWQWGPVDSPVTELVFSEDASDQLTGGFALGEGSEVDMLVGKGRTLSGSSDLPVMDLAEPAKNAETLAQLDSFAQGFVDQRAVLQGQWNLTVRRDALVAGVRPGASARLRVEGSLLSPSTDWRSLYVVALSGDLSESVRVGVQS